MTMSEKAAYKAGSRAASLGYLYIDNPYNSVFESGEKLAWSKGHNTYRANKNKVSMK